MLPNRYTETVDGCWEWTGGKNVSGHGVFMVKGKRIYAHRAAWESVNGPIPGNAHIHHKCRNPSCVKPDHLECLTHKDHMGEHANPERDPPDGCRRGHAGFYVKNSQGRFICTECRRENQER